MEKYKSSETLVSALKGFEGLRRRAYLCPAGVWTIGYGHTGGVQPGQRITEKTADTLLRNDLRRFESFVNDLEVCRTQGQFDALADFAFNLGCNALDNSTLLMKIRRGADEAEIRRQFSRWVYARGKRLPGLAERRRWEADRYFGKS